METHRTPGSGPWPRGFSHFPSVHVCSDQAEMALSGVVQPDSQAGSARHSLLLRAGASRVDGQAVPSQPLDVPLEVENPPSFGFDPRPSRSEATARRLTGIELHGVRKDV